MYVLFIIIMYAHYSPKVLDMIALKTVRNV